MNNDTPSPSLKCGSPLFLLITVASIGGFTFGYDTGVMSGVVLFWDEDSALSLSNVQVETLVAAAVGAAAVGALGCGLPMQIYGRKPVFIASSACFVTGCVLMASAWSFAQLLVGRLFVGLGVGGASLAVPVFLAEVAPPESRGSVVATYTVCIVTGQISAYALSLAAEAMFANGSGARWRFSLGIAAVPAAVLGVGFAAGLPDSPRWFLSKGRRSDAEAALRFIRRGEEPSRLQENVERDLAALQAVGVDDIGDVRALLAEVWARPHLRRIFGLGITLQAIQQFSGINALMYYGALVLEYCGFSSAESLDLAVILGLAQGAGVLWSTWYFDSYGRRFLLTTSGVASGVCLVLLSLAFGLGIKSEGDKALAVVSIVAYLLVFGCGLSAGPWVVNSEIYPMHLRGLGVSVATSVNWLSSFCVSISFITLVDLMGEDGTFGLLAGFCFLGALFIATALPDTQGKTLEEVELLFKRPEDEDSWVAGGGGGAKNAEIRGDDNEGNPPDQSTPLLSASEAP